MTLPTPHFDTQEIDLAGEILLAGVIFEEESKWRNALELVSRWRASHSRPLHTFQGNLRRRVKGSGIVARRLKRLPSILSKLERLPWLRLSQMQDIGGCRVVLRTADDAYRIAADLADSRIRHELINHKDFIEDPRPTGYRGLHLVYAYHSDQTAQSQGMKTEIQIRSQLQHQWATAVETVGTFIGEPLKSGEGDESWLRFFALMSSAIALREGTRVVPDTPADRDELIDAIRSCEQELEISTRLAAFQNVARRLQDLREINNHWVVLELDLRANRVTGHAFNANDWQNASDWYLERELEHGGDPQVEIVLVSASSLNELRRAYPNFFADLTRFRRLLQETVE